MPALNVRFVPVVIRIEPLKLTVLAPRLIARTLLLFEDKVPAVTANPAVVNVPLVTVSVCEPTLNASAS